MSKADHAIGGSEVPFPTIDDLPPGELPVTASDSVALIKELMINRLKLVEERDRAKEVFSAASQRLEDCEHKILEFLKAAGLDNFKLPGVGMVYRINKYAVRTPKTVEEKQLVFDYVRERHGDDALVSMLSINHATLNSFYNQEADANKEDPLWSIPGLDEPTLNEDVGFRKA